MNKDCYNISALPNYKNNCWLNAILISTLYSQYSRNLLMTHYLNKKMEKNPLIEIIMKILHSLYFPKDDEDNFEQIFNELDPIQLAYELSKLSKRTLIKYKTFKEFKDTAKHIFIPQHIFELYKFLGVNCIDIKYINDKYLLNTDNEEDIKLDTNPDVIIFSHTNFNNGLRDKMDLFDSKTTTKYQIDISKIDVGTLATYADEITFMGKAYVLNSCICINNGFNINRAVVGITCNKKKLVYNSYNKSKNNCSLLNHKWDVNKSKKICINPNECQLDLYNDIKNIDNLCFNFGQGDRTLIYVKKVYPIEGIMDDKEFETADEPILNDIQEEIVKIKEMSDICILCQFEKINGVHFKIAELTEEGMQRNRDTYEKLILENNIKSIIKVQGGKNLSLNKFNKKELITMINKNLNKCKKNKLVSLYQQLKN